MVTDDVIILIVITTVCAVLAAVLLWRISHWRYVKRIKARGWTWHGDATPQVTVGLNNAPFGIGLTREVSHLISGTSNDGGFHRLRL